MTDSIPWRSVWSGVDSGKLRWTCLLPPSPPTASCIFPWPRAPLGTDALAQAGLGPYASMCFPQWGLLVTDTVQAQGGRGNGHAGCATLAHLNLVSRTHFPRNSTSPGGIPMRKDLFSQGLGHHMAPTSRSMEPPCVAPGRDAAGFERSTNGSSRDHHSG